MRFVLCFFLLFFLPNASIAQTNDSVTLESELSFASEALPAIYFLAQLLHDGEEELQTEVALEILLREQGLGGKATALAAHNRYAKYLLLQAPTATNLQNVLKRRESILDVELDTSNFQLCRRHWALCELRDNFEDIGRRLNEATEAIAEKQEYCDDINERREMLRETCELNGSCPPDILEEITDLTNEAIQNSCLPIGITASLFVSRHSEQLEDELSIAREKTPRLYELLNSDVTGGDALRSRIDAGDDAILSRFQETRSTFDPSLARNSDFRRSVESDALVRIIERTEACVRHTALCRVEDLMADAAWCANEGRLICIDCDRKIPNSPTGGGRTEGSVSEGQMCQRQTDQYLARGCSTNPFTKFYGPELCEIKREE